MDKQKYIHNCKLWAAEAGEIAYGAFKKANFSYRLKADKSFVSQLDFEIETFLKNKIQETYPGHAVLGEEYGGELSTHNYSWLIDPVDGTSNFIHGVPVFCTMLALSKGSQAITSAVSIPSVDKLIWTNEEKVYVNEEQIDVPKSFL